MEGPGSRTHTHPHACERDPRGYHSRQGCRLLSGPPHPEAGARQARHRVRWRGGYRGRSGRTRPGAGRRGGRGYPAGGAGAPAPPRDAVRPPRQDEVRVLAHPRQQPPLGAGGIDQAEGGRPHGAIPDEPAPQQQRFQGREVPGATGVGRVAPRGDLADAAVLPDPGEPLAPVEDPWDRRPLLEGVDERSGGEIHAPEEDVPAPGADAAVRRAAASRRVVALMIRHVGDGAGAGDRSRWMPPSAGHPR